jgi:hypothetical protein
MIAALLLSLAGFAHAGVVRAPMGPVGLSAGPSFTAPLPALPSFLSIANPADAVLLAGVLREAQASPTALAVLAQVAAVAEARGRPVVVEILKIKESGTFDTDSSVLSLRRRDMKGDPRANVSTLIHELQHMLQMERRLPSDMLETELEAYVVDFRVSRELNDIPKPGSYDARSDAAFRRGLEPYMEFLRKEYPENSQFHKTRSRDYEARLRKGLASSTAKLERLQAERTERIHTVERMREVGHSADELRNYRQDTIAPLDGPIQTMERAVAWAIKDIEILANPALRAAARKYARSVVRRARAFQKVFSRD